MFKRCPTLPVGATPSTRYRNGATSTVIKAVVFAPYFAAVKGVPADDPSIANCSNAFAKLPTSEACSTETSIANFRHA